LRRASAWILILVVSFLLGGCGYKTSPRPASASIPGEIRLVEAHAYPDRVVLRWDIPRANIDGSLLRDLSGFKVYRSAEKIGEECQDCRQARSFYANIDAQYPAGAVVTDSEVVYSDKGVEPGNIYYYAVSVYNLRGREGPFSQKVTVPFEEAPPPPTGLRVRYVPDGVALEWEPPARPAGIRGYRIYRTRSEKVEDMKAIGSTRWAETQFVDKDVERGKIYNYQLRSLKMNQGIVMESLPSETVRAVVPELRWGAPESINTTSTSDGIRIYWKPVEITGEESRYNIYRSEAGKAFQKINPEPLRNAWFMDKEVKKGVSCRYAVTAFPAGKPEDESTRSASHTVKFNP
jgi:fibronectin type 3 domain-containing protein